MVLFIDMEIVKKNFFIKVFEFGGIFIGINNDVFEFKDDVIKICFVIILNFNNGGVNLWYGEFVNVIRD